MFWAGLHGLGLERALLVGCLMSQQHASVSQGRICSDNFSAATLRQKLQTKLSVSPSHTILTPGRPVPALTLFRQAPGRVTTGVEFFKSMVYDSTPKKSRRTRDSNPGSSALEEDALTTRPTRRCLEHA